MHTCMHAYIQTHTYMYTYRRIYAHIHIHTYIHVHILVHMYVYIYMDTHIHMHTQMHTVFCTRTCFYAGSCTACVCVCDFVLGGMCFFVWMFVLLPHMAGFPCLVEPHHSKAVQVELPRDAASSIWRRPVRTQRPATEAARAVRVLKLKLSKNTFLI